MASSAVYSRVKVSAAALATAAIASLEIGGSCEVTGGRQGRGRDTDVVAAGSECSADLCGRENGEAGEAGLGEGGPEGWGVHWSEAVEQFGSKICLQEEVASTRGKRKKKKKNGGGAIEGSGASADRGGRSGERDEVDLRWVGPAPWEKAVGGDGVPKFLCDTMVRGQRRM